MQNAIYVTLEPDKEQILIFTAHINSVYPFYSRGEEFATIHLTNQQAIRTSESFKEIINKIAGGEEDWTTKLV